jgi:hypothetical protein
VTTASIQSVTAALAAATAFLAALGAGISGVAALRQYRLRAEAQRAELDTQLAQLFAQLAPIANGRGVAVIPEGALAPAVERLAGDDRIAEIPRFLKESFLPAPVGAATQAAAISSIAYLGRTYDSLRSPARDCLETLDLRGYAELEALRDTGLASIPAGRRSGHDQVPR